MLDVNVVNGKLSTFDINSSHIMSLKSIIFIPTKLIVLISLK